MYPYIVWPNGKHVMCNLSNTIFLQPLLKDPVPSKHTIVQGEHIYLTLSSTWPLDRYSDKTRQIRTPVLRIPPAVTSQAKMKNWLHECQKWVSHMIGQYAHIYWGRTLIFNPMQDHDPSDISTKKLLYPLKRMRVIIRTSTDGVG